MNPFDWLVLVGTMVGIAAYGAWRTRHTDSLNTYLKGNHNTGWFTIGLSVMATQASTIQSSRFMKWASRPRLASVPQGPPLAERQAGAPVGL